MRRKFIFFLVNLNQPDPKISAHPAKVLGTDYPRLFFTALISRSAALYVQMLFVVRSLSVASN